MRRLQGRIVELTEASARATASGDPSLYCSHIRHVTFNAWLHAGGDLWPAFAAQVFRGVAGLETEAEQGPTQEDALEAYQAKLRNEQARAERIGALERELAEKQRALGAIEPIADNQAGKLAGTTGEIVTRLLGLRDGWRDLRPADALPPVLLVIALALFVVAPSWAGWIAAGGAVLLTVLRYADERRRLRADVRDLERRLEGEQAAQEAAAVAPAEPELLLPEFARREAAEWTQRAQADAVTQIRMRFERLSRMIDEGIRTRERGDRPAEDTFPIERVIVYIDDLDRCQHDVVVNMLETLKLLLSLPHFVAVVGVDPRWLFRSLQVHFRELLSGNGGSGADAVWAATPQNYLEKIFQYSLVLQPISAQGFANLVEELLAPPAPTIRIVPDAADEAAEAAAPLPEDEPAAVPPGPGPVALPPLDLTPEELVISAEEIEFIKGLAPLFETPRAAKRLANVYRMTRVSVGADRLMDAESYEPVLMLLAIGIGFPGLAGATFAEIARAPQLSWPDFVEGLGSAERNAIKALEQAENLAERDDWRQLLRRAAPDVDARFALQQALRRCSPDAVADRTLASFAPWIPVVAEFSFHPWQELLPPETAS
jgi:hypothetical protein